MNLFHLEELVFEVSVEFVESINLASLQIVKLLTILSDLVLEGLCTLQLAASPLVVLLVEEPLIIGLHLWIYQWNIIDLWQLAAESDDLIHRLEVDDDVLVDVGEAGVEHLDVILVFTLTIDVLHGKSVVAESLGVEFKMLIEDPPVEGVPLIPHLLVEVVIVGFRVVEVLLEDELFSISSSRC